MKKLILALWLCLFMHAGISAQIVNRNELVIDELMADPSPTVGLPNTEWAELRNCSSVSINLLGWKLGDASGISGSMPAYTLKPDSVVIVCTASAVAALSSFGTCISVTSFPTLDNAGDIIYLRSPQNKVIHAVSYTDQWYRNELKKDGGWSLEMIDTKNPCQGAANWIASTDSKGGTPGKRNSVDGINADHTAPRLLRAFATDSVTINLQFDEPLDSLKAVQLSNYTLSDGIGILPNILAVPPVFDQVVLHLSNVLQHQKIYQLTVHGISDCVGNAISNNISIQTGWASTADSLDVVINEILFNPRAGGVDYVELYNRSTKIIDLKKLSLANRNSTAQISNIFPLSSFGNLLLPDMYVVATDDASLVKRDYICLNPESFTEPSSMPSFNDDQGDVVLLNEQGKIVDELAYDAKWHFKLIDNPEGVSLERINADGPTQQSDNWHSAASSVGYGTPTYKNSQYHQDDAASGELKLSPEIISPDNDGIDDVASLEYQLPTPGWVANITIFDAAGHIVRYLQRNALCGIKGNFRWDGLGEKNQALPVGIYIFLTELFNLEGKKKQFKQVIVLARRQ
ncbi:MAG: lamin tail domain-containing protein [Sphingobacteriales bacterium]|nr:lamin tail domain-containing protein [Sphingobacteriales bacterium]